MKIKVGDEVKVVSGKDRGRTGKVERVFPKEEDVLISGINVYKRHYKPRKASEKGGIVDVIKPIHVSKVSLICPKCKSITRIGFKITEDKKVRICRKCDQEI